MGAGAQAVGRGGLAFIDCERLDARELRRVHGALVVEQDVHAVDVRPGEGRSGLEVQAVAQIGVNDLKAERSDGLPSAAIPSASVRVDRPT